MWQWFKVLCGLEFQRLSSHTVHRSILYRVLDRSSWWHKHKHLLVIVISYIIIICAKSKRSDRSLWEAQIDPRSIPHGKEDRSSYWKHFYENSFECFIWILSWTNSARIDPIVDRRSILEMAVSSWKQSRSILQRRRSIPQCFCAFIAGPDITTDRSPHWKQIDLVINSRS